MNQSNSFSFPLLNTARLTLRQLKIEDDKEIFEIRSNEIIRQYIDRPLAKSIESAQQHIRKINRGNSDKEWIYWGIINKNNGKVIGTICLMDFIKTGSSAEIGFELAENAQGKGFMQEALKEVIKYGFEKLKFELIEAYAHSKNSKSIKLLKLNGFIQKSIIQERHSSTKDVYEMIIFELKNPMNPKD